LPHFRRPGGGESPRVFRLSKYDPAVPCQHRRSVSRGGGLRWEYNTAMRRRLAMLLVALFSFSPIAPAVFASDGDSRLPACCRRGGKHGCAMMASQPASPSGHAVQAATCGLFPPAKAIAPVRTVSLSAVSLATFAELPSHPASRSQADAVYRIAYNRAGQQRAPPISPL
jgi:hypothetical protein